jgi:hypothetical protein
VRTTLTLDEDVATKLKSLARRSGRAFRDVVNETLRRGLVTTSATSAQKPFKVKPIDLGEARPGLSFDKISALLEELEGPFHK